MFKNTTDEISMAEVFRELYARFPQKISGYIVLEFNHALECLKREVRNGSTVEQAIESLELCTDQVIDRILKDDSSSDMDKETAVSVYQFVFFNAVRIFTRYRGQSHEKLRTRPYPEGCPENPETPPQ